MSAVSTEQAIEMVRNMDPFEALRYWSRYLIDVACIRADSQWYHQKDENGYFRVTGQSKAPGLFPTHPWSGTLVIHCQRAPSKPTEEIHNSAAFYLWKDHPAVPFTEFIDTVSPIHDNGENWKEKGFAARHTYHFDNHCHLVGRLAIGNA